MKQPPKPKGAALPKVLRKPDLKYPKGKYFHDERIESGMLELWHVTGRGWVIPVLDIRGAGRRSGYQRRAYAIEVESGAMISAGRGPHVTETATVYLSRENRKRLEPLIALAHEGKIKAAQIRDRRATRSMRRSIWGFQ